MEFQLYELPSGIKCILKRVRSDVVYSSFTIGSGTRDEAENEHGVAHLVEHLMFKGTEHRRIYHINSLLDNVGGELNAFTTKEETVVHSIVLKKDFARTVDLMSDVVFNSIYPEKELVKEIGVIIDEINAYRDTPSELIFDDFEDMIFAGSSLGRNILGARRHIKRLKREDVLRFIDRTYSTDRMLFTVVGNISLERFKALCDEYFGKIPAHRNGYRRTAPPAYIPQDHIVDRHTFQSHCVIGGRGASFSDARRVPLMLMVNMLGGMSANSRLALLLREKYGLSYNVESSLATYEDTGLVSVYFSSEEASVARCIELINKELASFRDISLTSLQLHRAQRQLIGQMTIASEMGESFMLNAARSFMLYGTVHSTAEMAKSIMSVTAAEVQGAANDFFNEGNLSMLLYR